MNRIRFLREKLNLRQIDVSLKTGIDQKTLSNYETGKTNPDSYALIKLADFFDVSIDYLVGRSDISVSTREELLVTVDKLSETVEELKRSL